MKGRLLLLLTLGVSRPAFAQPPVQAEPIDAAVLTDLSLEELTSVDVTSVSRRSQPRFTAAAAIYVVRAEELIRSGATSLADALRLVPGVHVARLNSNQWSVGIRGFGTRLSRGVLVLIDGRSVYNPLYAGTYWELQDTLLEDVDRIEVIRGPGGTLWGANAFNGVINIITKAAKETTGVLATAAAGTEERANVGVRQGGSVAGRGHYRVYARFLDRDGGYLPGGDPFDDWRMARTGARTDLALGSDSLLTVQGDLYYGQAGQRTRFTSYQPPYTTILDRDSKFSGGNLLSRWEQRMSERSEARLQLYYNRSNRHDPNFSENRDTFDLELDHRFETWGSQEITWGLGYRVTRGKTSGYELLGFVPPNRTDNVFHGFVQDSISLLDDRARLMAGTKVEHNEFSGVEVQPTGRLTLLPSERLTFWSAVSRAVRTPSPVEHDLQATSFAGTPMGGLPTFSRLISSREFDSEVVIAYEAGLRIRPITGVEFALSTFHNRFSRLLSVEPGTPFMEDTPPPLRQIRPIFIRNGLSGRSQGLELRYDLAPFKGVGIGGHYSLLDLQLTREAGGMDLTTEGTTEGSSPRHLAVLRLALDLPARLRLDIIGRFVDELPALQVDRYVDVDVRLAWSATEKLELALVGQNLAQPRHHEGSPLQPTTTQLQRGVYGKVTWQW